MSHHEISKKKVDIICPIYNKENYILNFLHSVTKLDSNFFNVILVDDGSSDNTPNLIQDYINKSKADNLFYFRKDNGGVSSARNFGLKLSLSEFTWFCDPDDNVIDITISDKLESILSTVDMIAFSYEYFDISKEKSKIQKKSNASYSTGSEFLLAHDYFTEYNDISTLWNKWYRTSKLKDIKFDEKLTSSEDRSFNLDVLSRSNQVASSSILIYKYYSYPHSTLSSHLTKKSIADSLQVDKKNIIFLSRFRDVRRQKKITIYKYLRDGIKVRDNKVMHHYFKLHKELGVAFFPFYSFKELPLFFLAVIYSNKFYSFISSKK